MANQELRPMMRQYWEFKARYKDCLLLFRLGDFYELFFEDAEKASRLLGLTLTSRPGGGGIKAPMCGVPYHSAHPYISKLLKMGEKVALCEQVEDPQKAKGLVKRDVVRVLTPGTLTESDMLEEKKNNYIAFFVNEASRSAIAYADLSTGEFGATTFDGTGHCEEARSEMARLGPAECVSTKDAFGLLKLEDAVETTVETLPAPAQARKVLLDHFHVLSLSPFGCEEDSLVQTAAAGLIGYLGETHKAGLGHLRTLTTNSFRNSLRLDPFTLDALEVVDSQVRGTTGPTLFSTLDMTRNAAGGRTLRTWLLRPSTDKALICSRLAAVEWLCEHCDKRDALRELLAKCADLERIAGRIGSQIANARDLVAAKSTIILVRKVRSLFGDPGGPDLLSALASQLHELPDYCSLVDSAIVDEPPLALNDGGIIRETFNAEVDELRAISRNSKEVLLSIQVRERRRTGIDTLKVQYNSVFGYFIEVSKGKIGMVPSDYQRKQTLTGAERYITPELKEVESKILGASERLGMLERELFNSVREQALKHVPALLETARALGAIDALAAFAQVACRYSYVKPDVDDSGLIEIQEGRHPVLERVLPNFVNNDTRLAPGEEQVLVVTGPNMAGKSTYMRQVGLIILMAHAGSFVPAKRARIGIVDGIYCRIGASDRLAHGQSTFMVEMTQVAQILNHATSRSLLIFDEVGRGTSTYDGVAIAWAIVEHICTRIRSKTLFATHYYELTSLASRFPEVKNYNVLVREWKHDLIFLYRIAPGRADRSYGVQVARLAGLPETVTTRASEMLETFQRSSTKDGAVPVAEQLNLFGKVPDSVRAMLEESDPEQLTPIQALALLDELRSQLKKPPGNA